MLSVVASLTPHSGFNQSPRNMYQCQMGKQTMGTPSQARAGALWQGALRRWRQFEHAVGEVMLLLPESHVMHSLHASQAPFHAVGAFHKRGALVAPRWADPCHHAPSRFWSTVSREVGACRWGAAAQARRCAGCRVRRRLWC